jgi:hypothetical protein
MPKAGSLREPAACRGWCQRSGRQAHIRTARAGTASGAAAEAVAPRVGAARGFPLA